MVGNQGLYLSEVQEGAVEFAKSVWTKVSEIAAKTGSTVTDGIKKIYKALTEAA